MKKQSLNFTSNAPPPPVDNSIFTPLYSIDPALSGLSGDIGQKNSDVFSRVSRKIQNFSAKNGYALQPQIIQPGQHVAIFHIKFFAVKLD
ncbi:MAG: hypothetical protein IKA65_11605, partial [Lentisphaeria bacterium]|nr:hypothetical protein [Lentisphaeria bacterium]